MALAQVEDLAGGVVHGLAAATQVFYIGDGGYVVAT
jgi:hypothetical protein